MVHPDYDGASVSGIVPALLGARDRSFLPAPADVAERVVVIVLDGLGWEALEKHAPLLPTLRSMRACVVTSVVPATTSAALTSFATGRPPGEHGIVGYRMRIGSEIMNVLRWTVAGVPSTAVPEVIQPLPPFMGREVPVVTRAAFRDSGFTVAHLRGTRLEGWRTPSGIVETCRRLAAEGAPLVYAYYDGIDVVAHVYGLESPYYSAELAFADRLVGDLLDALPSTVALLVTADHGEVHLADDAWIEVDPPAELVEAQAGDVRLRYLHARPGAARELREALGPLDGERASVFSRERFIAEGWLGADPPSARVAARIGDVVLAARGGHAFFDPGFPLERGLRAGHGSMTPTEMRVPLLAAWGRGRP